MRSEYPCTAVMEVSVTDRNWLASNEIEPPRNSSFFGIGIKTRLECTASMRRVRINPTVRFCDCALHSRKLAGVMTADQTTLAILAGGESTRMGLPKEQLKIAGQPVLVHLLNQLQWPGATMLVTSPGHEHPVGHDQFNLEATDPVAGVGPLRGILTALSHASTDHVIIATVDMPALHVDMLQFLLEQISTRPGIDAMMLTRPIDSRQRIEPFPSIFHRRSIPAIETALTQNRRSVHGLIDEARFITVQSPLDWPARYWTNLNTPDDLSNFRLGID